MISIVIPLWNKAPYVQRCLDSVLAQTYDNFEVIVVDDGSTDDGPEQVTAIPDRRIRLVRQPNGGVAVARNRGMAESRGEWIAFLDADDEWTPDHLATLSDLMGRYPQCGMVSASYWLHRDDTGNQWQPCFDGLPFHGPHGVITNYYEVAANGNNPINMNTFAVRRNLVERCGGFPIGIESGEDTYFEARCLADTDLAYSLHPTSVYHLFEEGKNYRAFRSHNPVDDLYDGLLRLGQGKTGIRRFVATWHKQRMTHAVHCGHPATALRQFTRAIRICPWDKKTYYQALMALLAIVTRRDVYELMQAFRPQKQAKQKKQ